MNDPISGPASPISRRSFLQSAGALSLAASLPIRAFASDGHSDDFDPIPWVNLKIGTGGHGHCFPGASMPFGAVQLSPDTYNAEWDWCSGYHVSDTSIMGFSHTHLSGTGCGDLLDFLVMAGTGPVKLVPGPRTNPSAGYRSRFSHSDEVAEPGYYRVYLKDPKVNVELTATERTGLHRYTFPQSDDAWLILDLSHSYQNVLTSTVYAAELERTAPDTLAGGHITQAWGNRRHCYFSLQLSRRPDKIVFYSDDKPVTLEEGGRKKLEGSNLKAVLHFQTHADEVILVRTGISGVSAEGAARNLTAEQTAWEFDRVREKAKTAWRQQLSRIHAEFANPDHQRIFYTSLYHMSLGPQLSDDVDGQYRGMDNIIHQLPAGEHNYTTFSLWDTFRAAHPAYTIFQTDRLPDFVNSLIRMAEQSPAGMAVWPLQGTETGTMTGYHSASVISEAIMKGCPGVDINAAYRVMRRRALVENFLGLGLFRRLGYIPSDCEGESVSKAFEYSYCAWAVSHVAGKLGREDDQSVLLAQAANYRNYFNPASGFMEPKLLNGQWTHPFNPIELGHSKRWRDYTESNAWQTTFGAMHDPAGTIALFGGRAPFIKKLDALFTVPSTLPPDAPPDIAGLVGQYAHGNEPSHHIAYLYVYAGEPWKTQSRVHSLLQTMYSNQPDGMEGNEDVGQMSAWYVLSALGFYAVNPVTGTYVLGSPLAKNATIHLQNGKDIEIKVNRKGPEDLYVKSFTLNGERQQRAWFEHKQIDEGGTLVFDLDSTPNKSFAVEEKDAPPSLTRA